MNLTPEFAYFIGLVQSDGCLKKYKKQYYVHFTNRNILLMKRFQDLVKFCLDREIKFCPRKYGGFEGKVGVNKLLDEFNKNDISFKDPPKPPDWIDSNLELFCAYLAGLIDGDGDVRLRRPKYPQCAVRITSSRPQLDLVNSIKKNLCKCSISTYARQGIIEGRTIFSRFARLEFCVSNKNKTIVKDFLLPYVVSKHKHDRINRFLENNGPARI